MSEERNLLDDPLALRRHLMLSALRFVFVGVVMLGIAITYDAVIAPLGLGKPLGIVMALGGMVGFFYGPKWVAKGWRTPTESDDK